MRTIQRSIFVVTLLTICHVQWIFSQKDLLKGILDKEDPVFNATLTKSNNQGEVLIDFYFTHSKIDELEISFWLKDLGTNFNESSAKKLVKGLEKYGNRQTYTINIEGLNAAHFYTIGIDYKNAGGLSRKFVSHILESSYLYQTPEIKKESPDEITKNVSPTPMEEITPCVDPDITIKIEPTGYCQGNSKPAALIQCINCQGKEWEFKVQIRKENGAWESLRTDGQRQQAVGVSLRTEPFCGLGAGIYDLQVLAWGKNCEIPIIQKFPTPIIVPEKNNLAAYQDEGFEESKAIETHDEVSSLNIPESCIVLGVAYLKNDKIIGTIEMDLGSPCASMNPTAIIKYIHPGYRDITLDEIFLLPGSKIPFEIPLEDRDMNRGIHTLQIIEQVEVNQKIQVGSSWIKAIEERAPSMPAEEFSTSAPGEPYEVSELSTNNEEEAFSIDEQELSTVNVTASDPNCNQIQDLQLVYGSGKADLPLFISWLSPRCCQEEGCNYTVWAGENPEKLRLLIKGNKPGAIVRELLQNLRVDDTYYEIVVQTGNGKRKAAYVLGEGPKYGFEEILSYRDVKNPPDSDEFLFEKEAAFNYQKPTLALENFRSCRIFRTTSMSKSYDVIPGEPITVKYDYKEKGYQYTLYFLPQQQTEWVIAPGTQELSKTATFTFDAKREHAGKYVILAYNPAINWGCLSKPISEAIPLVLTEE